MAHQIFCASFPGGGGALRVKISGGAPLEVQNGTQQDLNTIIDFVNFGGQNDRLHAESGGLQNGTQQDLNKMVDKVKLEGGGGKNVVQVLKMGGKTAAHTNWLSKRECPHNPTHPRPHFITICEFKLRVTVRRLLNWVLTCYLDLWPLTLTFCMDITLVNGNHSWKFHDDTIRGTLSKRCDGQTDGQTKCS